MKNELPLANAPETVSSRTIRTRRRTAQLDFALPMSPPSVRCAAGPRAGSRARAQWWFSQMRQIVAEGRDFDAAGVF